MSGFFALLYSTIVTLRFLQPTEVMTDRIEHSNAASKPLILVAWIVVLLQILLPLSLTFTPAIAATLAQSNAIVTEPDVLDPFAEKMASKPPSPDDKKNQIEQFWQRNKAPSLADDISSFGAKVRPNNTEGDALGMARSAINGKVNDAARQWLNQFGTARLQLNIDNDFHLDGSSLDMLLPLYNQPKNMLFTQLGVRNKDSRNTLNVGLGARIWLGEWMVGMNSFYDYDWTGKNRRMSMGLEAWRDYLKLSANNYFRLTDWHESRDFEDYNERPANGFDVRAEAYLPAYPQLGGRLIYEKYRGNQVALFGKDNLQKNPYAVTLGINYTPINLVTIGVDHRQGKGSANDTNISLQVNYRIGESWQSQIDPDAVAASRTLAGTRYDLVDRNNDIVLEYQKQQVIKLTLPEQLIGLAGDKGSITAQITSKYAVDHVEWDTSALMAAGGEVSQVEKNALEITFPPYKVNGGAANIYEISAIAYDVKNNSSNRATTRIEVQPSLAMITAANLRLENSPAAANGIAIIDVRALVTDSNGNPVAGQTVTFSATNDATITTVIGTTGPDGLATAKLTSFSAGISVVTASLNGTPRTVNATFIADSATARIDTLRAITNDAIANGSSTNTVEATIVDAHGNKLAGQQVTFSATNGAVVTTVIGTTGEDGIARATLTNETAIISVVTAQLVSNLTEKEVNVNFIPDIDTARITAADMRIVRDNALANNIETNEVLVRVSDATNNDLIGIPVHFSITGGATLDDTTAVTGTGGIARVTLRSTKSAIMNVVATLDNRSTQNVSPTFVPNPATARILALQVTKTDSASNGSDFNTVVATVVDQYDNKLPGLTVTFTSSNLTAVLTPLSGGLTDADGNATVNLTNLNDGLSPVTATINGSSMTRDTNFTLDITTARIVRIAPVINNSPADGATANTVEVEIRNAQNQLLPNVPVHLTTGNGASPTAVTLPTNAVGVATLSLTSGNPGPSAIVATLDNGDTASTSVTFAINIFIGSISVTLDHGTSDGKEANQAVVHVHDAHNNGISGVSVTLTSPGSAGTFRDVTPPGATTDTNGNITLEYTYTRAEAINITANVAGAAPLSNAGGDFTIPTITQNITVANALVGDNVEGTATITTARGLPYASGNVAINLERFNGATFIPVPGSVTNPSATQTDSSGEVPLSGTSSIAVLNVYFIVTMVDVNEGTNNRNGIIDGAQLAFF
ncbi:inverse autotransporter beta domain-containing protein [Yersinia sp. 2466 StPb PI]|uniref:inverse autotransporter beta domain-containing protein n=1 Tax=Yersinia sp. 2466 StPb PI TaxID=3061648 RepID=UPI00355C2A0D